MVASAKNSVRWNIHSLPTFFYLFWKFGVISYKNLVHVLCKEGDFTSIKYLAQSVKDDYYNNNETSNYS